MVNCQCQGIEDLFNQKTVSRQRINYHAKGMDKTTRILTDALKSEGVAGYSLLDIGGGLGGIQHALLAAGVDRAVDVDASMAYMRAAQMEAKERGLSSRIEFVHGNFVDLAEQIAPAEIVTLDRVLCCYDNVEALVHQSAAKAKKYYGLVFPRDSWLARMATSLLNFVFRLQRNPFRTFIHPTKTVEAIIQSYGFNKRYQFHTAFWQVLVYVHE